LIPLELIFVPVVDKVTGDVHLYFRWSHTHLQQKLVQVDVLRTHWVGACVVADQVELEFNNTEHSRFQHVLQEHSFLRVDYLVVAVFENFVAMDVLDVEMCVKSKPFWVFPLIFKLNKFRITPLSLSFKFWSSGSNY